MLNQRMCGRGLPDVHTARSVAFMVILVMNADLVMPHPCACCPQCLPGPGDTAGPQGCRQHCRQYGCGGCSAR
jgi:hypothetical protein